MITAPYRLCKECGLELPIDRFYAVNQYRRHTCRNCLVEADQRKRRADGCRIRHPRRNARGQVWCNRCQHYLDADAFKVHPSREGANGQVIYMAYCKPCTRIRDRERRERRKRDIARALADQDRRSALRRQRRQREHAERRRFVTDAIKLLLRRGLTKTEIARLAGMQMERLYPLLTGNHKVRESTASRFAIVLQASADLPLDGPDRTRKHRPHPAMAELLAYCLPRIDKIPRNRKDRKRT